MKILAITTAGAFALAMSVMDTIPATAQTAMEFYNNCGNGLTAGFLNRGSCHGYVTGLVNGMVASRSGFVCLPNGVTDTQLVMVVQAYMRSHPEQLNNSANTVIEQAVAKAFPCTNPVPQDYASNVVHHYVEAAMVSTAKTEISNLAAGLDLFKYDVGRYPNQEEGLQALVIRPYGVANWNGPYVKTTTRLSDPWGNLYQYRYPGEHGAFDLYSWGPRTISNQKPPIANW